MVVAIAPSFAAIVMIAEPAPKSPIATGFRRDLASYAACRVMPRGPGKRCGRWGFELVRAE